MASTDACQTKGLGGSLGAGRECLIGGGRVVLDGSDQGRDAAEAAPSYPFLGDLSEPALDQIQPRGTGGGEVELHAGVALEPGLDAGLGVGAIVVQDHVERQLLG